MNHDDASRDQVAASGAEATDEELFIRLFRHARSRRGVAEKDERRVRAAVHAEWRAAIAQRRQRRVGWSLAAAAALVAAVVLVTMGLQGPTTPGPVLASVLRVEGVHRLHGKEAAAGRPLASAAADLRAGEQLHTGPSGGVTLRWHSGEMLRLSGDSRIVLEAPDEVSLLAGRLFIDTHGARGVRVNTPAGRVRHLGTAYMLQQSGPRLTVSVREGRVALESEGHRTVASQGQQLRTSGTGEPQLRTIATWGAAWAWADALAPPFELDGRTVHEFIGEVARETGNRVEFEDASAEALARSSVLQGRVELEPLAALDLVLRTTDLVAVAADGRIVISRRR